ncbi:MAG: transposase, partial [Firmicutes bacterium]|nr:transposase [Bacillota bacterium]
MPLVTTYGVYIKEKEYGKILKETMEVYRKAVDFLISVRLNEKELFEGITWNRDEMMQMERLVHKTKDNPEPKYDFDSRFYKFPSEYRRDAIAKAIALVKSYESNLLRWDGKGKKPKKPKAGYSCPTLYKGLPKSYERTGDLTAKIKIRIRNTWDWIDINLRKTDVDYINKYCS